MKIITIMKDINKAMLKASFSEVCWYSSLLCLFSSSVCLTLLASLTQYYPIALVVGLIGMVVAISALKIDCILKKLNNKNAP